MGSLVEEPNSRYRMEDLGQVSYCMMSCHIIRNREKRSLNFGQHHLYLETIVDRLSIDKTAMVPATASGSPLWKENEPKTTKDEKKVRHIHYREEVGAIMWAATMTRPNIFGAPHTVAKFCESPSKKTGGPC